MAQPDAVSDEEEAPEDVTEEERAEEIRRLVRQQNMDMNYDDEEYLVPEDEEESGNEARPPKRPKRTAATARRDEINPPDLYFIGKCDDCVFYASYLDVTSNTPVKKKSTVTLPVFGPSRVIYDDIKEEATAEIEAKQYALGMVSFMHLFKLINK